MEPQERLARAAQLCDLVEDQRDGLLNPPVGIFLQLDAGLHEADGRGHDEFASPRFLLSCRERTLAQQIKFVLVETALQAEQQSIITLPWA